MNNKITFFAMFILFVVTANAVANDLVCEIGMDEMYAMFVPKTVSCDSNQFLPANSLVCLNCPTGFSCNGGDFVFDEYQSSGIDYKQIMTNGANNICAANFPADLYATWTPHIFNCTPGFYLPMNVAQCQPCPENYKCTGGSYAFNTKKDQGNQACTNGTFSPGGTAYCYEHKLHVGDDIVYLKSVKITTPSLNIKINNDVFYANMTTTPAYMTSTSEHYLKISFNGVVYYVCDDTTCAQ